MYIRSGYSYPDWDLLEGENEETRSKRCVTEERSYIDAYKARFNRVVNDSQTETLDRVNQGKEAMKQSLASLQYSINSDSEPEKWKAYLAFRKLAEKEYMLQVISILSGEAFKTSPLKPYNEYYAKNICERLAKAWANGEHRPTFRKLVYPEKYPIWEERQNANMATRVTIEGGLKDFEACFYTLKSIPDKFKEIFNEAEARAFANAYPDVRFGAYL